MFNFGNKRRARSKEQYRDEKTLKRLQAAERAEIEGNVIFCIMARVYVSQITKPGTKKKKIEKEKQKYRENCYK